MGEVNAAFEVRQPEQPDGSPGSAVVLRGRTLTLEVWHPDDYDEAFETEEARAEWFDEALEKALAGATIDAVEMRLRPDYSGELYREWLVELLARHLPATVRSLHWGASSGSCFVELPAFGPLREALPALEVLRLEAEWHHENTELDTRGLRHLGLDAPSLEAVEALVDLDLSAIEHLELWLYDHENEGAEVLLLDDVLTAIGASMPALRQLTLHGCEQGTELIAALPDAPVFGQLEALGLIDCTNEGSYVDEAGAEALLSERYAGLAIDVTGSFCAAHHTIPLRERLIAESGGRIHTQALPDG